MCEFQAFLPRCEGNIPCSGFHSPPVVLVPSGYRLGQVPPVKCNVRKCAELSVIHLFPRYPPLSTIPQYIFKHSFKEIHFLYFTKTSPIIRQLHFELVKSLQDDMNGGENFLTLSQTRVKLDSQLPAEGSVQVSDQLVVVAR